MKIGDYVYAVDAYDNYLEGTITKIHETKEDATYISLYDAINKGMRTVKACDVFPSNSERTKALTERSEKQIREYKKEMNALEDIVRFCLKHCVARAEEYTDWDARTAVEEKLAELTSSQREN